ncbi:MAG: sensor domain-containing diguanylate cyclase [Oscillatoriales cyanobacterium]|nr:MAG: sensor domain-containing diguanylate cyclase [Oscillatoriales cyanobacterium]
MGNSSISTIRDLIPFDNFEAASRAVLAFLHQRLGFNLWMMTRTSGEDWIVLQVEDHGYDVSEGTVLRWTDSFCSQMVQGFGPRVAPNAQEIAVYAAAPIGQQMTIGAYIGVPIQTPSGQLFGTLCAIDPEPKTLDLQTELPLLELLAQLLGSVLAADLAAVEQSRLLELMRTDCMTDLLTGLYNRRAWEQAIELEEARARRYGTPYCVFIADLDGLKDINDTEGHAEGDRLLQRAAQCLQTAVRKCDLVARLGGDEFGVLAIDCARESSIDMLDRLRHTFESANIEVSIGMAMRDSINGILGALRTADLNMYRNKRYRKGYQKN